MKPGYLLLFCLLATMLRGQIPVWFVFDPITVGAVAVAGATIKTSVEAQNKLHRDQLKAAILLNRSLGDWRLPEPSAHSRHLYAPTLVKDHLTTTRQVITWDNQVTRPDTVQTLLGQNVPLAPEDIADHTHLDAIGRETQNSLIALAREIEATQQEVAATYSDMTGIGLTQQKYEKLRGKVQALNLHLENLQAQQQAALDLLQAQATVNDDRQQRDGEISALVQEANHKENVGALSALKFNGLPWR
jgi:hypothetical protein